MNGKIHNSVGFSSVDGAIRQLTLRERLQQIINLGQPQVINRVPINKDNAEMLISESDDRMDSFFGFCHNFKKFSK
tara:strand:- start:539 stop:766 length:228 start_codon:yes stop_codon:yes gene_type:complete